MNITALEALVRKWRSEMVAQPMPIIDPYADPPRTITEPQPEAALRMNLLWMCADELEAALAATSNAKD